MADGRTRDMAVAQTNLTWHDIRVGDLDGARRRLADVEAALARRDAGGYGVCEACGRPIGTHSRSSPSAIFDM